MPDFTSSDNHAPPALLGYELVRPSRGRDRCGRAGGTAATTAASDDQRSVTSLVTGDSALTEAYASHGAIANHEPTLYGAIATHEPTISHGQTGSGSFVAPQGGNPADTDDGGTSLPSCGPATRRTVSVGPDVSLGPLGWLAVLLAVVLLTVLAHAANVRSDQLEHRGPSPLADPAYVLAQ